MLSRLSHSRRRFGVSSLATLLAASLFALLAAPLAASTGPAGTPGVDEIVHRANLVSYYQGQDGKAQVDMTITDSQGRTQERRLSILRRDAARTDALEGHAYYGPQRFYVYFHRPADVSKMAFLVWKAVEGDDNRWLYLPGLDLVKRIAASDKRTSFVGSDFYYEDVSGRALAEDTHALQQTTDDFYVVRSTPKQPGEVEFAYYVSYIHKATFLPVQVTYFDANDRKLREYKALKVEAIQGRPTVTRSQMANLQTGSRTEMTYSDVAYDVGLPESIFTERSLRRAPRKHLR